MTDFDKRDHFAALAMQGELAATSTADGVGRLALDISDLHLSLLTKHWYRIADAMLAESKKPVHGAETSAKARAYEAFCGRLKHGKPDPEQRPETRQKPEWHTEIYGPVRLPIAELPDGWRVPTRAELLALHDSGEFPEDMRGKRFWSSTPYQPDPTLACVVNFINGSTNAYGATNTFYVRLVRSITKPS